MSIDVSKLAPYMKTVVAVLAALGVLATAMSDGSLSLDEGVAVVINLLAAFGVYAVPNKAQK